MRKLIVTGLGGILAVNLAGAQQPPLPNPYPPQSGSTLPPIPNPFPQPGSALPGLPQQPTTPRQPGLLPQFPPAQPGGAPTPSPQPVQKLPAIGGEMALPYPEQKFTISALDVSVKRVVGGWEVWAGQKMLRNTGDNENNARDLVRVMRDLRPTEWVTIGGTKPVVEYGLTNGRPVLTGGQPLDAKEDGTGGAMQAGGMNAPVASGTAAKYVVPVDLRTTRVEAVRGVWVVRDDNNILLNFGADKGGAEQAGAVIQRYGFNRIGTVGTPAQPVMSYLFVSTDPAKAVPGGALAVQMQIDSLARTGIPIPGVGFTGEMIKIDARRVEARKDGFEWVVACGPEVLGRFGPTEWSAREAARTIQDARFTEFCKLGGASGLTFFLVNGKVPTRAPLAAQGRSFDIAALKVQQVNNKWAVTEAGRQLFEVGSAQEGETVVRVLKAYGFDQSAHLSAGGAKGGITFFVKNGR